MSTELLIVAALALVAGCLLGWVLAIGRANRMSGDLAAAKARAEDVELIRRARDEVEKERNEAVTALADLRARAEEKDAAHAAALQQLKDVRETLPAHFGEAARTALENAQKQFLQSADERFKRSEQASGEALARLLQPVSERLTRYETTVTELESKRADAFSTLHGQIEMMRAGQERVSNEAAKLVNSLRNAPKSRGRWGEQQLRNVLESCGLSEHADFQTEVSIADGEGGRLRPDVIVNVPGGKSLVIDAKVSLNAYQDAFGAVDEDERRRGLDLHAAAMRAHVNGLGNKAYWSQFEDAPDYVIMFVPGEHFLSAALEQDPTLWDFAFEKRVLLATPTNLIAIARTVAAVWRQEKMAKEARQIGQLGKELYDRLAKAMNDLRLVGSGLNSAVKNYNDYVSSMNSRAVVTARKLRDLNIEAGQREVDEVPQIEALASHASHAGSVGAEERPALGLVGEGD